MKKLTAVFVTATGTDIGKTFVVAGLIHRLRREGRHVRALKPVVSGFDERFASRSDPGILLQALGRPVDHHEIARISPWRYAAALSPHLAALRERRLLDFDALVRFSRDAASDNSGVVLIEGIGGIMVPLNEQYTVLDWMMALQAPLILVTGTYLGAMSHTLSAVDVLMRRGLRVVTLVVSETAGSAVSMGDTAATIIRFTPGIEVVSLPRLSSTNGEHVGFGKIVGLL